jgi:hypothetical protein
MIDDAEVHRLVERVVKQVMGMQEKVPISEPAIPDPNTRLSKTETRYQCAHAWRRTDRCEPGPADC